MLPLLQQGHPMTALSVRELNNNLSAAIARVEAGEVLTITRHGKPVAEMRPRPASKMDDPEWRAAYERALAGLREGVPGLTGPVTYAERTE